MAIRASGSGSRRRGYPCASTLLGVSENSDEFHKILVGRLSARRLGVMDGKCEASDTVGGAATDHETPELWQNILFFHHKVVGNIEKRWTVDERGGIQWLFMTVPLYKRLHCKLWEVIGVGGLM